MAAVGKGCVSSVVQLGESSQAASRLFLTQKQSAAVTSSQ